MTISRLTLPAVAAFLFILSSACSKQAGEPINQSKQHSDLYPLFGFENLAERDAIDYVNAEGEISQTAAQGSGALRVRFLSAANAYSRISLRPAGEPWDWSSFQSFSVAFEIANEGEVSTYVYLDIQDVDGAVYTRAVNIPVGGFQTYYAKMDGHDLASSELDTGLELNFKSGLRNNPPSWSGYGDHAFVSLWGKKRLNLSGIKRMTFRVEGAIRDKELTIDHVRIVRNPEMNEQFLTGIVDQYGQNAKVEFEGKIHSDEALAAQRENELLALNDGQPLEDRSRYSGWVEGPRMQATGYFRTEKVDGKWALVTPDGYLYFATGLDVIRLANSTTMTGYDFDAALIAQRSGDDVTPEDSMGLNPVPVSAVGSRHLVMKSRGDMFEWLPSYDDELGKHFGYRRQSHSGVLPKGEVYSFYSANLERKYGQLGNYLDVWRKVTVDRMLNWGFTSLGNWTDPSFYNNQRIPFFANGWIIGDFKTVSSGNDFWAPLPDVFDPVFEERAKATMKQVAAEVQDSPWCVGVFVDNEKSFGRPETDSSRLGIVLHTLRRDGAAVPTKAAFTKVIKAKYGTIESLNRSWRKSIASWEDFDSGIDSSLETQEQRQDYSDLLHLYADKYFEIVARAVKLHLPNHLYLGARFPDWGMPIEVVRAAAKHADVISYNSYKEGLPDHKWEFLSEIDKPSIIGEFHIGASDSGLYHPGLIHASNQNDRARMYQEYMQSVIDNPYFVGAHWFQYHDSPLTGRAYDGENYNVGFVSVVDVPYQPMVEAAKALHGEMYERRFGDSKKGEVGEN